jgi:DNA-binding XRE family transcriptional regulator
MAALPAPPAADSGPLAGLPLPAATERLTAVGAGWWVRHLEATGRAWATVLPLGGAGALVELRARARPRPLVALLRTDADCRAALAALTAPGVPVGDPAGALPPALRAAPDVWRATAARRATPEGPPAARWPAPRPPSPGPAPRPPRRLAPVLRRVHPTPRPPADHDGGAAGRELRRRREAAGLGQREAAARLCVSRSYLAEIERGRRAGPSARAVVAAGRGLLASAVGAEVTEVTKVAARWPS